jgi:hypothetical protein
VKSLRDTSAAKESHAYGFPVSARSFQIRYFLIPFGSILPNVLWAIRVKRRTVRRILMEASVAGNSILGRYPSGAPGETL